MSEPILSLPPLLEVPAAALTDAERGARYEWVEADGHGGWAAGSVIGAATRREHGLLIVARPGTGRMVLLSRFEETIVTAEGGRLDLGANFYPGAVHPEGHRALAGFSLDPWPVWRYRLGACEVVREIFRSRRSRALLLRYRYDGPPAVLELRPLFAGRPITTLGTANEFVRREAEASERMVAYQPYEDVPAAILTFAEGDWTPEPTWYYRTTYPHDREADAQEDLFSPGLLRLPLRSGVPTTLACGLRPARVARVDRRLNDELARREAVARRGRRLGPDRRSDLGARLALAADAFTTASMPYATLPVPGAGTRDVLMALPWLTLLSGGEDAAIELLRALGARQKAGLLPVAFDAGEGPAARMAADVPLWYVEAVAALADRGADVGPLLPVVTAILDAFTAGTRFGIRVGPDGLVLQGPAARPLTWMDAFAHDQPVTPRWGRAVDINALWYNALLRASGMAGATRAEGWIEQAERCRAGFDAFWWDEAGWLVDSIDAAGTDHRSLRPNQLLAVSLPHAPVVGVRARSVVEAVERALLLPYGVRTLAPGTDGYGRTDGGDARQHAGRHQGSAWTFWIGPFARAYLRAHQGDRPARQRIETLLDGFQSALATGVLGFPGERIQAEPPHHPEGAPASASALAGLIEALWALDRATTDRPF